MQKKKKNYDNILRRAVSGLTRGEGIKENKMIIKSGGLIFQIFFGESSG